MSVGVRQSSGTPLFVYYESIKRELKIKSTYECRCDERLQTKTRKLRAPHTTCTRFFSFIFFSEEKRKMAAHEDSDGYSASELFELAVAYVRHVVCCSNICA
jgi:hypothetical protein